MNLLAPQSCLHDSVIIYIVSKPHCVIRGKFQSEKVIPMFIISNVNCHSAKHYQNFSVCINACLLWAHFRFAAVILEFSGRINIRRRAYLR